MRQKKERKNGGFTLIEILVAITILGIVIVPFMHSFVTASRTNAKAKTLQNATALGTNLMEEIKANSIEDLAFEFNYPTKNDSNGAAAESRFDIIDAASFESVSEVRLKDGKYEPVVKYLKSDAGVDNLSGVTSSILYKDYNPGNSDEYEYLGQSSGMYYFVMKGAKSGTGTYDALITMDANAYKTADDKGYNDQTTPVIDSIDVRQDAFYVQPADLDAEAAAKFLKKDIDSQEVKDFLAGNSQKGKMKRTITVDLKKSGALTTVKVKYEYFDPKNSTKAFYEVTDLMYSNEESPTYDLRNIYLCYEPNYMSDSKTSPAKDEIVINNEDNIMANFYLVKQKHSTYNSYMYEMKESTYYCEVCVKENVGSFNASTHKAALSLKTNLDKNIYNDSSALIHPYKLVYGTTQTTQTATSTNAKRILSVSALEGAEVKDRIYDVTVAVYEPGQSDNQFNGSPIAVITGSKDN